VREGPAVVLHAVHFNGNLRTRESILWDEMIQRPGEPFSRKRMLADQRRLRNLGLFQEVRFRPLGLKERAERVVLSVDLEEKKPYFLEAGLGYETRRGAYINGKLGDRNALGLNLLADTSAEVSEIGYRWEAHLRSPALLRSKVKAAVGVFGEEKAEFNQQFGTRSLGGSLSFARQWTRKYGAELALRAEEREQFAIDGDSDEADQESRRRFLVLSPALRMDTRDDILRPRKGLYARGSVDMSKGVEGTLDDFFKYHLDCRGYWSPLGRLTLAGMLRVAYIDVYGQTTEVASDQLLFLGGTSTVRGYKENLLEFDADGNPLGGRLSQVGSIEARFDAGYSIEISAFCDLGRISETQDVIEAGDVRTAVGMGLRYMTPIGPVGLLYGHKLDPRENESDGRVHFSFGYTF
jgi:outer membrane protein insertion porin family